MYDIDWLKQQILDGKQPKYVTFWGHQPRADGTITSSCFSQWWEGFPFAVDGITYTTAEHYMMAEKARLFNDETTLAQILVAGHPGEAKKLGRQVANFDEATWQTHRYGIVVAGNAAKFGQHASLGTYLRQTGERVIVEASPYDKVWGIGLAANDGRANNPDYWNGLNLLGFALMEVRDQLGEFKNE